MPTAASQSAEVGRQWRRARPVRTQNAAEAPTEGVGVSVCRNSQGLGKAKTPVQRRRLKSPTATERGRDAAGAPTDRRLFAERRPDGTATRQGNRHQPRHAQTAASQTCEVGRQYRRTRPVRTQDAAGAPTDRRLFGDRRPAPSPTAMGNRPERRERQTTASQDAEVGRQKNLTPMRQWWADA